MILVFVGLVFFTVAGLIYAFMYNSIEERRNVGRRMDAISTQAPTGTRVKKGGKATEAQKRRKDLETSLKRVEAKQADRDKNIKNPPLYLQINQAGLSWSMKNFWIASAISGGVFTILALGFGMPVLFLPAATLVGGLGVPRWVVSFLRKRRIKAFLDKFPDAIDVIVRAVKSGLPLNDGIRLIAGEAAEPVKTEFQRMVDAQNVGMSTPDAAMKMQETMPCSEAAFFGIVIQIQSQAGGNLSEALGNLSKVLRDRKKMKAKVNALSMEAKASAVIIGALPFIVALLVHLSSPDYLLPLFETATGNMILGVSAVWMMIGVFVMRQMINFDF